MSYIERYLEMWEKHKVFCYVSMTPSGWLFSANKENRKIDFLDKRFKNKIITTNKIYDTKHHYQKNFEKLALEFYDYYEEKVRAKQ